jgi:hypothetical protein
MFVGRGKSGTPSQLLRNIDQEGNEYRRFHRRMEFPMGKAICFDFEGSAVEIACSLVR